MLAPVRKLEREEAVKATPCSFALGAFFALDLFAPDSAPEPNRKRIKREEVGDQDLAACHDGATSLRIGEEHQPVVSRTDVAIWILNVREQRGAT